jgi:hypothetical protein
MRRMRAFLVAGVLVVASACGDDGDDGQPSQAGGGNAATPEGGRAGAASNTGGRSSGGRSGDPAGGASSGGRTSTGGAATTGGATATAGGGSPDGSAPLAGAGGAPEVGGTGGEEPTGGGAPPASDETVGSYAELDLENNAIYTVDLGVRDYPVFLTEGATHTFEPSSGWNSGPSVRITPPLAGGYGALGSFNDLWQDGTFTIRKLNLRFEVQFGAEFGTHWPNDDLKFVIVHSADALGAETNERPMCNWANVSEEGSGILAWAVGAGTVKNFNRSPPYEPAYSPSGNEDFYIGPSEGTFNGHPVLGPESWISVEVEIVSEATSQHPEGLIRSVLTARDGTVLTDLSIPWTYDSNWSLARYISEVQVIGGYYNTGSTSSTPDNFYRIADHITFAANRPGLLGPRSGFVE